MQISFIVPIFNAEKTLKRCVDSLFYQGLDEGSYEIILVDDGSTDGSWDLCNALSVEFPCIRVVSQENKGVSEARNSGIREARGEYLCFVDADDCLVPSGLVRIIPYCDGNTDLIRYWCELVFPNSKTAVDPGDGCVVFRGTGKAYLREYGLETFCSNYLYRREFIERAQLRFKPRIVSEDFPFMFDVMMADPSIVSVALRIYRYFINPGSLSTTRTLAHSRRWVKDMMETMSEIKSHLDGYRTLDPALFSQCQKSLDGKIVAMFSRVLSSEYTIEEFRAMSASCRDLGLLPFSSRPSSRSGWFSRMAIKTMVACPLLYPLASRFYTKVFLPYLYPRIDRNG